VPAALNFAFGYWQLTIFYRLLVAPLPRRVRELAGQQLRTGKARASCGIPPPAPQRSRRDDYLAAGMVFVCVMMLAAAVAVPYAPLPRAQLMVPLATSVPAALTAVLTWRRSR
jgi:hypothetical protein